MEKNRKTAGADERSPSRPQYFSWINNTNEGSTEEQTLINLDYFAYLKDTYGMQLDIYAWDAGNLDGSRETYETLDSPKLKAQYPNGYAPIAKRCKDLGIKLGVWCGPGGFGDSKESAEARKELMVSLCRDHEFGLFKMDGVCGQLSEKYHDIFVEMMTECRKYSPDLVLLNHRLWLGEEGMKHATTELWNGIETYTDVHITNHTTAPHHRGYFASRGNTPGLGRLYEDHGVCISSCVDYFEDELIFQSFGRGLVLAPEIYGNPWLMRDDELPHLARIYNLHRRYRDILVTGMLLPGGKNYPENAIARGSATKRLITVGNDTWETKSIRMRLDMEIGLAPCERVTVALHHPYEEYIGEFAYGDAVEIPLPPFRAVLIEVTDSKEADVMLTGCRYEVLHEQENGKIDTVKIVSSNGKIAYSDGRAFDGTIAAFDETPRAPKKLAEIPAKQSNAVPENSLCLLETAMFAQDHDSLEAREIRRSGETKIPQVKAARDAFFGQERYRLRGIESQYAFDGNEDTFFDGQSRYLFGCLRIDGGCLRVDFGAEYDADTVTFEYFDIDTPTFEQDRQYLPPMIDSSTDLQNWNITTLESVETLRKETVPIIKDSVHNIVAYDGRRRVATYPIGGKVRYLRMPKPLDRIYKIALYKDGKELSLTAPRANNLMPYQRPATYTKTCSFSIDAADYREGCYLSVGLQGTHGREGAYAVLEADGKYYGAPDRASSYPSNVWECLVRLTDSNYTYYIPLTKEMCGKPLSVHIVGLDETHTDYTTEVYLCDANKEIIGVQTKI